jgi:hypothetical protein
LRLKPRQAVVFALAWLAVFLAFAFPYLLSNPRLLLKPFGYLGVTDYCGLSGMIYTVFMKLLHVHPKIYKGIIWGLRVVCLSAIVWALIRSRSWKPGASMLFVILTFYILNPGWSIQYYAWLAVFFFLFGLQKKLIYTLTFALLMLLYFLLVAYDSLAFLGIKLADFYTLLALSSFFISLLAIPFWISLLKNNGNPATGFSTDIKQQL